MRRTSARHLGLITRINVTPVVDVALVLVIILLVTAPLLPASDLPVNLPQARTREAEDERNVSVTLGADGRLAVDDVQLARPELISHLAARLAEPGNREVLVVLRADSGARYAEVRSLLADLRAAGAHRLAIATRQKTEAR